MRKIGKFQINNPALPRTTATETTHPEEITTRRRRGSETGPMRTSGAEPQPVMAGVDSPIEALNKISVKEVILNSKMTVTSTKTGCVTQSNSNSREAIDSQHLKTGISKGTDMMKEVCLTSARTDLTNLTIQTVNKTLRATVKAILTRVATIRGPDPTETTTTTVLAVTGRTSTIASSMMVIHAKTIIGAHQISSRATRETTRGPIGSMRLRSRKGAIGMRTSEMRAYNVSKIVTMTAASRSHRLVETTSRLPVII
jgi:hypothetical protein